MLHFGVSLTLTTAYTAWNGYIVNLKNFPIKYYQVTIFPNVGSGAFNKNGNDIGIQLSTNQSVGATIRITGMVIIDP